LVLNHTLVSRTCHLSGELQSLSPHWQHCPPTQILLFNYKVLSPYNSWTNCTEDFLIHQNQMSILCHSGRDNKKDKVMLFPGKTKLLYQVVCKSYKEGDSHWFNWQYVVLQSTGNTSLNSLQQNHLLKMNTLVCGNTYQIYKFKAVLQQFSN
jgi:hypothetical protein